MYNKNLFTVLFLLLTSWGFRQNFSSNPAFNNNTRCDEQNAEVSVAYLLSATGVAHSLSWGDGTGTLVTTTSSTSNNI